MNSMLDAAVLNKISARDFISFVIHGETRLGMVVEENGPELWVVHFQRVTAEITRQYSLAPITAAQYPMAYNGNMVEVIGCAADKVLVSRSSIIDVAFILPLGEVESGMFFMSGSTLAYFCRYYLRDDGIPTACNQSFYFQRHIVEPFSHRIFSFLNLISRNIKRAMYHSKLSAVGSKSFRCHASSEAFYYLQSKLPSALIVSTTRRESQIIYYDNLQMEARSCVVNKVFLRIMTKPTLVELQKVLGSGI